MAALWARWESTPDCSYSGNGLVAAIQFSIGFIPGMGLAGTSSNFNSAGHQRPPTDVAGEPVGELVVPALSVTLVIGCTMSFRLRHAA